MQQSSCVTLLHFQVTNILGSKLIVTKLAFISLCYYYEYSTGTVEPAICAREPFATVLAKNVACLGCILFGVRLVCVTQRGAAECFQKEPPLPRPPVACFSTRAHRPNGSTVYFINKNKFIYQKTLVILLYVSSNYF